jgi:solute carrier family 35 (UDP-sugar transporter), member A1/2/3
MAALSLIVLVLQNSTLVLLTRYSRFSQPPGETYHTSTLVLNQEVMKMVFCLLIFFVERKQEKPDCSIVQELASIVWNRETLKLIVPAGLFTLQNFLIFVALSHLDAMTFQVLSQTKLLSAAVFSVWLLDRRLNRWQWVSLVLLTLGVYFSQQSAQRESFTRVSTTTPPHSADLQQQSMAPQQQLRTQNFLLGSIACIISGLSSSFAGVYFEKVVKTTAPSLAVRNIHLSLFGIPFAVLSLLVLDVVPTWWNPSLPRFRFWQGYNFMTWCLVLVHAFGGLLVAVVVKYADNILKGFATGVAVIFSGVFAALFWEYEPSRLFVVGCLLVTASTMLYHKKDNTSSLHRSTRHVGKD